MSEQEPDPDAGRHADRELIRSQLLAYTRHADLNQPEQQAAVFTMDGRVCFHPGVWIEGRRALAEALRQSLARFSATSHHLSNEEIVFGGPDRARAESVVLAWHRRLDGSEWTLYGRYVDVWVRTSDGWRLAQRELRAAGASGRDASELAPVGREPS